MSGPLSSSTSVAAAKHAPMAVRPRSAQAGAQQWTHDRTHSPNPLNSRCREKSAELSCQAFCVYMCLLVLGYSSAFSSCVSPSGRPPSEQPAKTSPPEHRSLVKWWIYVPFVFALKWSQMCVCVSVCFVLHSPYYVRQRRVTFKFPIEFALNYGKVDFISISTMQIRSSIARFELKDVSLVDGFLVCGFSPPCALYPNVFLFGCSRLGSPCSNHFIWPLLRFGHVRAFRMDYCLVDRNKPQ